MLKRGYKSGLLTVSKFSHKDASHRRYYKCRCKCGKKTVVREGYLKYEIIKSCGCLRGGKRTTLMSAYVGDTANQLTILSYKIEDGAGYVKCKCTCGRRLKVLAKNVIYGRTKSCGCLRRTESSVKICKYHKVQTLEELSAKCGVSRNGIASRVRRGVPIKKLTDKLKVTKPIWLTTGELAWRVAQRTVGITRHTFYQRVRDGYTIAEAINTSKYVHRKVKA